MTDTVILLGHDFGLLGGFKKAKSLLKKLDKITSFHTTIIASTTDPYQTNLCRLGTISRKNSNVSRIPET